MGAVFLLGGYNANKRIVTSPNLGQLVNVQL
jgi:hypothetical protein